ncbi:MAG: B12-binding domain-containing radical SAM protein [Chloroflexota bacterium]|nr:B12-binding domain-containing radical SAM protein [Chloroflexota bacterium]
MIDVLLAHSYFLKYDSKQLQKMRPYAPLATLYAASALRARGYSVALFDAMLADGEDDFVRALDQYQPRVVALYEDSFNFLSKMCLSRMRAAACHMSELACARGATVLAAGPDVSDHPELYFPHGVQFALVGEADHTLLEIVDCRLQNADWDAQSTIYNLQSTIRNIPGLAFPDPSAPSGVFYTPKRAPERHPDVFPLPAWDLLDVEPYRAAWTKAHGYFSLNMVSTRGCPFHCNWCAKPIWGQRYAMRSPASVADELALVKRTLRPDHIWFADDIFGLRPRWVAEFGREVAARDAAIPFMIQSRVDLMTEEAVAGLKQAGCAEVWMGAESGSQRILDAMEKGTQVEEIAVARARLGAAGIKAGFFIQFGYPGETFDDIMSTVQLVRDTLPDSIGVSVSYPLPGTRFHTLVREQLGAQTNWSDSDDLAMLFQGTYKSPFYRKLHTVLHEDLDLRRKIAESSNLQSTIYNLQSTIDQLNASWFELGRMEERERNTTPTLLVREPARAQAPDLSKEWN